MVALDEDGALPAGCDGARQDAGRVLENALERVGLLRPSQLEDDRGGVVLLGRLEDDSSHVEGLGPQVDGRNGHPLVLVARAGLVKVLDARRASADSLAGFPDDPASGFDGGLVLAEGGAPGQVVDAARPEACLVGDDESLSLDPRDAVEGGEELFDGAGNLWHAFVLLKMAGQAHSGRTEAGNVTG